MFPLCINIYFKYAWTDAFILYPIRDTLYYFISDITVLYAFDNLITNIYIFFFFRCSNNITREREAITFDRYEYCIFHSLVHPFDF